MLLSFCSRAIPFIAWILLLTPSAFPQEPVPQRPNIRVRVDRVNVGVIVTDSRGQFIGGLRREDFHLIDDGAEQPITDFLSVDEPAQILLLIEAGPAVYLLEGGHLQAVHALLDGLAPGDRVAIARYNAAPEAILDFTSDKRTAAGALDQLSFNLGFGQLNLATSLTTALDSLARNRWFCSRPESIPLRSPACNYCRPGCNPPTCASWPSPSAENFAALASPIKNIPRKLCPIPKKRKLPPKNLREPTKN